MYKTEVFSNEVHVSLCRKSGIPVSVMKWEFEISDNGVGLKLIGEKPNLLPHIEKQMNTLAIRAIDLVN